MEPRTKLAIMLLGTAIAAAWAMTGAATKPVEPEYRTAVLLAVDEIPMTTTVVFTARLTDGTICHVSVDQGGTAKQSSGLACK